MATLISQETWDNMPKEEKEKIRKDYRWNLEQINNDDSEADVEYKTAVATAEMYFGKENLHSENKIKTWEDIKNLELIDETLEEQLGALSYWNKETKAICDKCSAALKIAKLIELGYGGMITEEEWNDTKINKYCIIRLKDKIGTGIYTDCYEFIAFHTLEQREEFMSYHENVKLLKQYYIIK